MKVLISLLVLASTLLMCINDQCGSQAEGTRMTPNRMSTGNYRPDPLQIAGSRLPDCTHACGSCTPCRLVMVHLNCGVRPAEAETCPMAYKCMCSNKAFHVP